MANTAPAVQLAPQDWRLFRDLRLRALASDPAAFGSTHAKEAALSDDEWRARLDSGDGAVFAVMQGDEPAGMLGIARRDGVPPGAIVWGLWVAPYARGQGVSDALQQACRGWAVANGIAVMRLMHRAGNAVAQGFTGRHGYRLTGSEADFIWPDGKADDRLLYELVI